MALTTPYQQAIQFRGDRFNPITLAESTRTRVILACFRPGQFIPVHRPEIDLTLVVLEGEGVLDSGDQKSTVAPGAVAFIPAGEARGIRASTPLIALFIVTPLPTEADHRDVIAGLQAKR